jgi:hypothetical protein
MEGPEDGFREQRRRKRNKSEELRQGGSKKAAPHAAKPYLPRAETATRNYYAPLRAAAMDTAENTTEGEDAAEEQQRAPSRVAGRPPPIVLTSAADLILLQKHLKGLVTGSFEFRSTRNGTRVITKEMADYSAIRSYFDSNHLHYFTFHPKSEKPIKAVIRQLPGDTPAEDISNGLQDLGFSILSVKQMTANCPSPEGGSHTVNLPLFLVTLTRTPKSQEIFKLSSLCHIMIKVEAYRAQNGLTQCFNCQKFGHVWANFRQPGWLWCGGGHLHKECPEAEKEKSTPNCCNCNLQEGERPHPSSYRGCRHAKEESLRRRNQRSPNKGTSGRTFSSNYVTPGQSFAAALRSNPGQQPPMRQAPRATAEPMRGPPPAEQQAKPAGQSVQTSNVNSTSLDDMFKVATVVQQIMTELNGAVSEEGKIVAITKIVLSLMKRDGH